MDRNDEKQAAQFIKAFADQARACDLVAHAADQAAQAHRKGAAALLQSAEAAERQVQEYRALAQTSRKNVAALKRKVGE